MSLMLKQLQLNVYLERSLLFVIIYIDGKMTP